MSLAGCTTVAPNRLGLPPAATSEASDTSAIAPAPHTSGLMLTIRWPERKGLATQAIPEATEKIVVTIRDANGAKVGEKTANRPAAGQPNTPSALTFDLNPSLGTLTLEAVAYSKTNERLAEGRKTDIRLLDSVAFSVSITLTDLNAAELMIDVGVNPGPFAPSREAGDYYVELEDRYLTGGNEASGSQWVYRVRESGQPDKIQTIRLIWENFAESWYGGAEILEGGEVLDETNLRWGDSLYAFMIALEGPVYQLAPDPALPEVIRYGCTTRRPYYPLGEQDPWAGARREVWFKPGVGVIKVRDVRLRATPNGPARETREMELLSASLPVLSAVPGSASNA